MLLKLARKQTFVLSGTWIETGLSPTLFNIYINDLAKTLEQSSVPDIKLHDTEVKCLLYADNLVLISPTKEGLQQHLDHLNRFCQTWVMMVNLKKTNIMIFQKRSGYQGHNYKFYLNTVELEHRSVTHCPVWQ